MSTADSAILRFYSPFFAVDPQRSGRVCRVLSALCVVNLVDILVVLFDDGESDEEALRGGA